MNIVFHDNFLCERGSTVALYDYAHFNEEILNNKSIILFNSKSTENKTNVIEKFKKRFRHVCSYESWHEVDSILHNINGDLLYLIKQGQNDGKFSKNVKSVIHCVFNTRDSHGDVYSAISNSVLGYCNQPIVPHMINIPHVNCNMREKLKIPNDALVFGRYGGYNQFDIPFVHMAVYNFALHNSESYFLFANTCKFCPDLHNIIHIDKIIDLNLKSEFINTCDAMLWGRSDGETFGIAIGEFSTLNKPIIACKSGLLNHVKILKNKAIWYDSSQSLYNVLLGFTDIRKKFTNWNCYQDYTPDKVMQKFKEVYIDE